jgi:hypothetical protein
MENSSEILLFSIECPAGPVVRLRSIAHGANKKQIVCPGAGQGREPQRALRSKEKIPTQNAF